jgi:hypothetical protein
MSQIKNRSVTTLILLTGLSGVRRFPCCPAPEAFLRSFISAPKVIAKKAKGRTMLYASVFHVPYSGRKLPFVFHPLLAFVGGHGCNFLSLALWINFFVHSLPMASSSSAVNSEIGNISPPTLMKLGVSGI